jgi:NNP family nitrate/nitrite transporter-like MFS transporter
VMGLVHGLTSSYLVGFVLLAATSATAAAATATAVRRRASVGARAVQP